MTWSCIQCSYWEDLCSSCKVAKPQPSTAVWRKALRPFPDANSWTSAKPLCWHSSKRNYPQHGSYNIGPPRPQTCNNAKTLFGVLWKMSRIFRECFLRPFSLGPPWELKDEICEKTIAKISLHFSLISCKSFARTSLWGIAGAIYIVVPHIKFIFLAEQDEGIQTGETLTTLHLAVCKLGAS